jgi:vacuolar-type H+-ATPase subunit H
MSLEQYGLSQDMQQASNYGQEYYDKWNELKQQLMSKGEGIGDIGNVVLTSSMIINGFLQHLYQSKNGVKLIDSIKQYVKGEKSLSDLSNDIKTSIGDKLQDTEFVKSLASKLGVDVSKIEDIKNKTTDIVSNLQEKALNMKSNLENKISELSDTDILGTIKDKLNVDVSSLNPSKLLNVKSLQDKLSDYQSKFNDVKTKYENMDPNLSVDEHNALATQYETQLKEYQNQASDLLDQLKTNVLPEDLGDLGVSSKLSDLYQGAKDVYGGFRESLGKTMTNASSNIQETTKSIYNQLQNKTNDLINKAKQNTESTLDNVMDSTNVLENTSTKLMTNLKNVGTSALENLGVIGGNVASSYIPNAYGRDFTQMALNSGYGGYQLTNPIKQLSQPEEGITKPLEGPEEIEMKPVTEFGEDIGENIGKQIGTEVGEEGAEQLGVLGTAEALETPLDTIPVVGEAVQGLTAIGVGLWSGISDLLDMGKSINPSNLTYPSFNAL